MPDHIQFDNECLTLLDQRVLPLETRWIRCVDAAETAAAITDMVIRGAPAIGIAAAYGLALEQRRGGDLEAARALLLAARPTAVNLRWALERLDGVAPEALADEARALHAEDIAVNRALGDHGARLLGDARQIYTHCNAGALATGGWGTALGIVRSAVRAGRDIHVWAGETRPFLQGARLTAWELSEDGIATTLVADVSAATLMQAGQVDAVIVGCDRVAANGDTANKIGTLGLAVLARHYGIPFYVAMPTSTLDRQCPTGAHIPIEERDPTEVRGYGTARWAADVPVFNPAFDVTPAALVTAWVSEFGTWAPPFPPENPAFVVDTPQTG